MPNTAIIAVPHCHWHDGWLIDLTAVAAAARTVGAALVIDGTQSIGAAPFDLAAVKPAFLFCSAYKWLLGPDGLAFLYVDRAPTSPADRSSTIRIIAQARPTCPAVLLIHENRGLVPYIEGVARRLATEGFMALAPDGLSPVGGYPGNDDDGRTLQASLDQAKLRTDMANSARHLKAHALSSGKLGVTGFCWGGGTTNYPGRYARRGCAGWRPVLWRGSRDGGGACHQGGPAHPIRRE